MASIGLYDIDFNHGKTFSVSLPLMQAYARLKAEGHQVIMMQPYEKTGRYNKIYYFKDNKKLIVPAKLTISNKGSFYGYGFYGASGLSDKTKEYKPDFAPYELNSNRIKNKSLYNKVKNNSIVDWREKNFSGARAGAGVTFITDRDFLEEDDWQELFQHYDNNIEFLHPLKPKDFEQAKELLSLYQGNSSTIVVPPPQDEEQLKYYLGYNCICFNCKSDEEKFIVAFMAKMICNEPIYFARRVDSSISSELDSWAANRSGTSFKEFMGDKFNDANYFKFKYRILLKQNPKTFTYKELEANYLTF